VSCNFSLQQELVEPKPPSTDADVIVSLSLLLVGIEIVLTRTALKEHILPVHEVL
jgi:hypothetical protein